MKLRWLVMIAVMLPSVAMAASLKVCVDDTSLNADTVTMQLLANGNAVVPDVLAGSTLTGTKRCGTVPFPAALVRGQDFALTVKGVNALGEVGPASNAVTFHSPSTPAQPTGFQVQIVVP